MSNFSCLGRLKLLNYTFPGGRPAKPEINANLSPAWLAGALAELGKKFNLKNILVKNFWGSKKLSTENFLTVKHFWIGNKFGSLGLKYFVKFYFG